MGRSSNDVVQSRETLVEEMGSGDLGDQRLNDRRDRLLSTLERSPDKGFPDACANDAEVEALYRFLRNRRVSWEAVLAPHLAASCVRCQAVGEVLVLHDTTDIVLAGDSPRVGLTTLGVGRHGFWVHASLAVSAEGLRAPLGLLALTTFVRPVRQRAALPRWQERIGDPDKETRCWADSVATVRGRLGTSCSAIHVMDRGADSYELFSALVTHGDRFVVRLAQDRRVLTSDGLRVLSAATPPVAPSHSRQVRVARRREESRPRARAQHPPRTGRVAIVQVTAQSVALQRPRAFPPTFPPMLTVNVVTVAECDAPPGEEPLNWRLLTTEPIATVEQIDQVVDWYRTRWTIEEFFKALKTGCAYEKRQLESRETLLVALALLAPIAWQLLLIRHLARCAPQVPATTALSSRLLQVLRGLPAGRVLGRHPTASEALLVIARLGGHLKQNGPPGWLVLARGMQKLLHFEAGWTAAENARTM